MKKTIPFELFGEKQTIYFNILRTAELERSTGLTILEIINQKIGINLCLIALRVGMKHHYPRGNDDFYANKMEENEVDLEQVMKPIVQALMISGVFPKNISDTAIKKISESDEFAKTDDDEKNA